MCTNRHRKYISIDSILIYFSSLIFIIRIQLDSETHRPAAAATATKATVLLCSWTEWRKLPSIWCPSPSPVHGMCECVCNIKQDAILNIENYAVLSRLSLVRVSWVCVSHGKTREFMFKDIVVDIDVETVAIEDSALRRRRRETERDVVGASAATDIKSIRPESVFRMLASPSARFRVKVFRIESESTNERERRIRVWMHLCNWYNYSKWHHRRFISLLCWREMAAHCAHTRAQLQIDTDLAMTICQRNTHLK